MTTDAVARPVRARTRPERGSLTVRAGLLTYQSKPLTRERAERFAKMQRANPRVLDATVEPCQHGEKFVVCWLPSNPERQRDMFERYQTVQYGRALAEMDEWGWEPHASGKWGHVTTLDVCPKTNKLLGTNRYRVTDQDCSCPHFKKRCRAAGANCKHIIGWVLAKTELVIAQKGGPAPRFATAPNVPPVRETEPAARLVHASVNVPALPPLPVSAAVAVATVASRPRLDDFAELDHLFG